MGIGDLLGSISPAFGLFSGQGLGSYLKYLSPAYDIASLVGGQHSSSTAAQAQPSDIQSADFSAMPQMANPSASPFSIIGNALMKSSQGQTPPPQVQQAYAPQRAPIDMGLLQQLLASIGRR